MVSHTWFLWVQPWFDVGPVTGYKRVSSVCTSCSGTNTIILSFIWLRLLTCPAAAPNITAVWITWCILMKYDSTMGPTRVTRRVLSVHSIVKLLLLLNVFEFMMVRVPCFLKLHACEESIEECQQDWFCRLRQVASDFLKWRWNHIFSTVLAKLFALPWLSSHYALAKKHGHSLQTFVDFANKSWLVIFRSVRVMVQ